MTYRSFICHRVAMVTAFFCLCRKRAKNLTEIHIFCTYTSSRITLGLITSSGHLKEEAYAINTNNSSGMSLVSPLYLKGGWG